MTVNHTKIDRCTPVLTEPHRTIPEKISATRTHYNALVGSSEWATAQATLDKPAAAWLKTADQLETGHKELDDLLKQVDAKRVALGALGEVWAAQTATCLAGVKEYCAGSRTRCKTMGFGAAGRTSRPPATTPVNLEQKRVRTLGSVGIQWLCDGRWHEYQVQHASNPADPATYSAPVTVSQRKFVLAGQARGTTLHFRVLVLDPKLPGGQSDWTPWLAVVVG